MKPTTEIELHIKTRSAFDGKSFYKVVEGHVPLERDDEIIISIPELRLDAKKSDYSCGIFRVIMRLYDVTKNRMLIDARTEADSTDERDRIINTLKLIDFNYCSQTR